MKFVYHKTRTITETHEIRPSDIYRDADALRRALKDKGLRIVAFRVPAPGETVISSGAQSVWTLSNNFHEVDDGNGGSRPDPRFIVEKITDHDPLEGIWE